jgi:hypothetical protein
MNRPTPCPGPVSRRSFLEVGAIGLGGLGLADFLRLRAEASTAARRADPDTSVIMLWLPGGLSHMDMYDLKPDAPSEYRGPFRPIRTNVSGIDVSELLPLHAQMADKFSLIRSISHDFVGHTNGSKHVMTSRLPKRPNDFVNEAPAGASIVAKMREHIHRGVPHNVMLADANRTNAVDGWYALGASYLGPAYRPFEVLGNPNESGFKVQNLSVSTEMAARLNDRRTLLGGLDQIRREIDRSGNMAAMDRFNTMAYDLLTSERARSAFDLSKEDPKLRERYGNHAWGQRTLLARRLVEAGSSFVTVVLEHPTPGTPSLPGRTYNWDCHAINCHVFDDLRWKLPLLDQLVTALIEDIHQRGLDKKVLVLVLGEFGHTPRINYGIGTDSHVIQPGRDHWPRASSILVAGGGMRTGQVVGSTNTKGEVPKDRPLTPNDLWATIYRHLGIDYNHSFLDHTGRPMPILPFGDPIAELI